MISIAVMTHPIRLKCAEALMDRIPSHFKPKLFVDTDSEGIWPNAMRAWRSYNPNDHYHMVLQDDIAFCEDFFEALPTIIKSAYNINPDYSISFCDNFPRKTDAAISTNCSWFLTNQTRHAQALVQPTHQIDEFIEYSERHVRPEFYHDDGRLEIYMTVNKKKILHTVPSLVEHDDQGSVKRILEGLPKKESYNYQSYKFIGEDGQAKDIDWDTDYVLFKRQLGHIHRWAIGLIPEWNVPIRLENGVFQFETSFLPYDEVMKDALKERGINE